MCNFDEETTARYQRLKRQKVEVLRIPPRNPDCAAAETTPSKPIQAWASSAKKWVQAAMRAAGCPGRGADAVL